MIPLGVLASSRVALVAEADPLAAFSWVWRFESDSITGVANGAEIATWPDTSGNSRNATQAAPSRRPVFAAGAFGAIPGVRFTGSNGALHTEGLPTALAQPTTIWVVSTGLSAAYRALLDGITSTNRNMLYRSSGGTSRMFAGSGVLLTNVAYETAGVVAAKFNGDSSRIWLNGSATDGVSPGNQTLTGLSIANTYNEAYVADQTYGAVLVIDAAQSAADMNTVGRYLAAKYGYIWTDIT